MIDTHAHIHDARFDADRAEVVRRAAAAGVERIVTVGCDLADSRRALETAARYGLSATVGIHPHEAKDAPADLATAFDALVAAGEVRPVAIGETGLDYYYSHSPRDRQREVFVAQIRYARERDFPLVFHQRDAFEDFVVVLRDEFRAGMRGVVHCFTGDLGQARLFTDEFGLKLGIGGVLTFKSADGLRAAVGAVGLDHLILETDCPYLAPVPHRGQRNEPAFLPAVADLMAQIVGTEPETVVARTSATARNLFGP